MTGRVIAIIGTAGRDKSIQLLPQHWDFMCQIIGDEVKPNDIVVSGGAAWADHVAIWAFGTDLVSHIKLHLPAPFIDGKFKGEFGTSGGTCNYYHSLFSKVMGFDSLDHIKQITEHSNVTLTIQPEANGYAAMAARNIKVAKDCTHMIAFTFGEGDVPADGGTKMTWDMAAGKERAHITLPIKG